MKFFLIVFLSTLLLSNECEFSIASYSEVCKKTLSLGVDLEYIVDFLTSPKSEIFDEISFELMQPKKIEEHKQSEKRANNELVKYIPELVKHLDDYKSVYDKAESSYGVNREIIAAILLKETRLAKITPKHDSFVVFNTLLLRTKPNSPREKWLIDLSKSNMSYIIKYCFDNKLKPNECNLASSYAGAIGISQFMPNNLHFTTSYSNTTPDITKMEDAILSTANFLHQKSNFDTPIEWSKIENIATIESSWYDYEFEHQNASFVYEISNNGLKKYNCFACQDSSLEYLRSYVKKIMTYNNSSNYAIGVIRLAYEAAKLSKE